MSAFTGQQGKGAMRRRREAKRAEAEERNAAWDALDYITKFDRLHRRPGFCSHQRDRIRPSRDRVAPSA